MAGQKGSPDTDKIKEVLKKAGLPVGDKNRMDQVSQDLSRSLGSAEPQLFVCNDNYCVVVKPEGQE